MSLGQWIAESLSVLRVILQKFVIVSDNSEVIESRSVVFGAAT